VDGRHYRRTRAPADIDERVRAMLMVDGWRPDMQLAERADYFNLDRLTES
jgi:hypothetical protein